MTGSVADLVRRSPDRLTADPSRVITRLFVPGQEGFDHQQSRASPVLERLLALEEDDVRRSLEDVLARFGERHHHLRTIFSRHARVLADRLDPDRELSEARQLLLGAIFTSEYAIEGAALCNPSLVAHPDQTATAPGSLRAVMSVRGIGEGHRSSIGFRAGTIDASGAMACDAPPAFATTAETRPALLDAAAFRSEIDRLDAGVENADYVLRGLADRFSRGDLEERLGRLHLQVTRSDRARTIAVIRQVADRSYTAEFDTSTPLDERVLWPAMAAEGTGMEDARFVCFCDDDGSSTYYATYTAYGNDTVSQQLLQTGDFRTFVSSPIVGTAAANKGLALFPRRIGGRYVALSRSDRESNTIAFSDSLLEWESASPCQVPTRPWEVLQLGNCGSPIETAAGWLVLTHGVGPMRTYSIGAILLDIDDPTHIVGQLRDPLLQPMSDEQNGYVPNVVYSCGALVHAGTLVLPYGIGDSAIGVATIGLDELLSAFG